MATGRLDLTQYGSGVDLLTTADFESRVEHEDHEPSTAPIVLDSAMPQGRKVSIDAITDFTPKHVITWVSGPSFADGAVLCMLRGIGEDGGFVNAICGSAGRVQSGTAWAGGHRNEGTDVTLRLPTATSSGNIANEPGPSYSPGDWLWAKLSMQGSALEVTLWTVDFNAADWGASAEPAPQISVTNTDNGTANRIGWWAYHNSGNDLIEFAYLSYGTDTDDPPFPASSPSEPVGEGTLSGTISFYDEDNKEVFAATSARVSSAIFRAAHIGSEVVYSTTADSNGDYSLTELPAGDYATWNEVLVNGVWRTSQVELVEVT